MSQWITKLTQNIECFAAETAAGYWLVSQYYRSVIKREAALAKIMASDRVLCIGGGICPFSAILFHQITGAKVTVIDKDLCCIPQARRTVERLGLSAHVRVLCQDGTRLALSPSEYSVIHFALQVTPMERVFAQIDKQAAKGTRMLIRRPKKQLSRFYSRLASALSLSCQTVAHKARNIESTLLYTKQERPYEEEIAVRRAAGAFAGPHTVAT